MMKNAQVRGLPDKFPDYIGQNRTSRRSARRWGTNRHIEHHVCQPQVTLARIFTYSAAGVRPLDGFIFMVMEAIGAVIAVSVFKVVKELKTR